MWHDQNFLLMVFGFVIALVLINHIFRTINRGQTISALRKAMESGKPLSPDVLKALESAELGGRDRLHGALVLIAVSLGMVTMGVLLRYGALADETDAEKVMLAIFAAAVIPGFVGIALLFLHILRSKKDK